MNQKSLTINTHSRGGPDIPKTQKILAGLAVGMIALTGCGSTDTAKDEAAQSHTEQQQEMTTVLQQREAYETLPPETPAIDGTDRQQPESWADEKVYTWFEVEGAEDFSEFYSPFNLVQSWEQGDDGEVILTVDSGITAGDRIYNEDLGPANDLWLIAAVMIEQTLAESPGLEAVTAVTADGQRTETVTRDYMQDKHEAEQNVVR